MGQTSAPSPQRGRHSQGRCWGEAVALAPEDWASGSVQVQTQPHGLWPTPSPQLPKLGNSRNRT